MPRIPHTVVYDLIKSGGIKVNQYSPSDHRFWLKVDKEGDFSKCGSRCWHWTGSLIDGYGQIMTCQKTIAAHRYSWLLHIGDIPDGLLVLHRCDNRRCVNPSHLFVGTYGDNAADRNSKGRQASHKGMLNGRAKLNEDQVLYIRSNYKSRDKIFGAAALSRLFGVDVVTIYGVTRRRTWVHLPEVVE